MAEGGGGVGIGDVGGAVPLQDLEHTPARRWREVELTTEVTKSARACSQYSVRRYKHSGFNVLAVQSSLYQCTYSNVF